MSPLSEGLSDATIAPPMFPPVAAVPLTSIRSSVKGPPWLGVTRQKLLNNDGGGPGPGACPATRPVILIGSPAFAATCTGGGSAGTQSQIKPIASMNRPERPQTPLAM